jgi:hypothetical protein
MPIVSLYPAINESLTPLADISDLKMILLACNLTGD